MKFRYLSEPNSTSLQLAIKFSHNFCLQFCFISDLGSNTKKITFRVYGHSKEIDG